METYMAILLKDRAKILTFPMGRKGHDQSLEYMELLFPIREQG